MMFRDPKTGEFYEVDMSSQEQLDEAARKGLVYACMHYLPPEDMDEEDIGVPDDIKDWWKEARGIDINT